MSTSVSIEDIQVGPYLARMRVHPDVLADEPVREYEINLSTLTSLRQHIDNAIDSLLHRKVIDAVCGDCEVCQNVRLVKTERHGNPWTENCPVCKPKLDEADRNGLLR